MSENGGDGAVISDQDDDSSSSSASELCFGEIELFMFGVVLVEEGFGLWEFLKCADEEKWEEEEEGEDLRFD